MIDPRFWHMHKVACWRRVCTVCLWQRFKVHALCDLLITRRVPTSGMVWFLWQSTSPMRVKTPHFLSYLHTLSWRTCATLTRLESFVDGNPLNILSHRTHRNLQRAKVLSLMGLRIVVWLCLLPCDELETHPVCTAELNRRMLPAAFSISSINIRDPSETEERVSRQMHCRVHLLNWPRHARTCLDFIKNKRTHLHRN